MQAHSKAPHHVWLYVSQDLTNNSNVICCNSNCGGHHCTVVMNHNLERLREWDTWDILISETDTKVTMWGWITPTTTSTIRHTQILLRNWKNSINLVWNSIPQRKMVPMPSQPKGKGFILSIFFRKNPHVLTYETWWSIIIDIDWKKW